MTADPIDPSPPRAIGGSAARGAAPDSTPGAFSDDSPVAPGDRPLASDAGPAASDDNAGAPGDRAAAFDSAAVAFAAGGSVYIVDDDPLSAELVGGLMARGGFSARQFASAEAFLAVASPDLRGCVIADIRMGGMSGLELQAELHKRSVRLPVIVVSGYAEVESAVLAMKQHAFDFQQKPIQPERLLDAVRRAMHLDAEQAVELKSDSICRERYLSLTPREVEVMALVVAGMANKRAAMHLGLSEKTIEVHRGNVMKKMQVDSVPELVRAGIRCGAKAVE